MPRKIDPRLGFSYGWLRGEDFWGNPMSDNMLLSALLLHPAPLSMTQATPPAVPVAGSQYVIPVGATGAWSGFANHLVAWVDGGWFSISPFVGLRVYVQDLAEFRWWDGSEWVEEFAEPGPSPGTIYDIAVSVPYVPAPGEVVLILPIVQAMTLLAGAPGSRAASQVPPVSNAILSIRRGSTEVGTITLPSSGTAGSFQVPANAVFAAGDRLRIVCPETLPSGFGEFGAVLRMSLQ